MNNKDYSNSCIYCIRSRDKNILDCYVGSTYCLENRKVKHYKNLYDSTKNKIKLYAFIRNNGGMKNFYFDVLEEVNAADKYELMNRERYYFDIIKPTLNCVIPYNSKNCQKIQKQRNEELENKNKEIEDEKRIYKESIDKQIKNLIDELLLLKNYVEEFNNINS